MAGTNKKRSINEDEAYAIIQRYSPATIFAALQEIYQFGGVKIDWKTLAKRSSTGISNAREYQMLWRHLAYRHQLVENFDGAEPLDDDSDIEFELEAIPAANTEVASQVAACVRVLMPSSSPSESGPKRGTNTEASLTAEISNGQAPHPTPDDRHGGFPIVKNIAVPASLHKQSVPTAPSSEGDGNETAGAGLAAKKKRKPWTKEEDTELIAAVERRGEGSWATIVKEDFKHERTAPQLAQRWATLKKRRGNSNSGGGTNCSSNSTMSEKMVATRNAFYSAIDGMPMYPGAARSKSPSDSSTVTATLSEASPAPQSSNPVTTHQRTSIPSSKPQSTVKNLSAPPKPTVCSNFMLKEAAINAGGRVAQPSDAASLLKAAQSKNVHHIPGSKKPVKGGKSLPASKKAGLQSQGLRHARPLMMPPPPPVSLGTSSSGTKLERLQPTVSSATVLPQLAASTEENAQRKNRLETEAGGGQDEMELGGAMEKNNKQTSVQGETDSNAVVNTDKTQGNCEATSR